MYHGLYKLHLNDNFRTGYSSGLAHCLTASTTVPLSVWHSRLGHPCKDVLIKALLHCNISFGANKVPLHCVVCHLGKARKLPFCPSLSEYSTLFQLVVADVWGPAPITSNGFRYYVAFTDACTRYTWVYFLRQKLNVLAVFPQFHRQAERTLGILQRLTCPYISAQNGLVECKHRQIVEVGLSMLADASMPLTIGMTPLPVLSPAVLSTSSLKSSSKLLILFSARKPRVLLTFVPSFNSLAHSLPTASLPSSPTLVPTPSSNPTTTSHCASTPTESPPPPSLLVNSHPMVTRSKVGVFKLKVYMSIASSLSTEPPTNIHEAMQHDYWCTAVQNELQALIRNNTWSLCSLPCNCRAIACKWQFKVKQKADGTMDRYKARLVAKVFSQHVGLDFQETFSLIVRAVTIRTPPRFELLSPSGQKLVCKLNKPLYGLRQAPRAWFHTLKQFLTDKLGFHASKVDPSLFVRTSSNFYLLLMAYVDDIVITGSSNDDIDTVVVQLHNKFALKDMGSLNFFLGIEVRRIAQGLFLYQKKYVMKILKKIGMLGAAVIPTPMVSTPKLVASVGSPPFTYGHLYRSVVGMLQYLCITRPDLSFCVNKLSQYMNSPSESHWKALECYSDADWASSVEDRRSTTGYVVYLGSNPIAWCSKKQAVVSRSSSEAEYRSLANCVSELLWIKQLLGEIGMPVVQSPVIWCDNTSTISMAANPTHHARVKHVEIDHHFVREKVLDGSLQVNFVPSANQIVDVLTKPITPKQFAVFRRALRVFANGDEFDN
ncbi:hypothetical protein CXB51_008238 [Gossypium anomalum]|uniref:Reverse transcriptase Ty1/copia-type domain-containing protein n=1 Tax=Gossypium anomalum TaxID=47600 RepID=A0A8J5YZS7_9ROSI|nr:hypothetical protein CXB51_008238 [Gossypium anomalum]